jgi:hypothetical protein
VFRKTPKPAPVLKNGSSVGFVGAFRRNEKSKRRGWYRVGNRGDFAMETRLAVGV